MCLQAYNFSNMIASRPPAAFGPSIFTAVLVKMTDGIMVPVAEELLGHTFPD